jgi:hypothetical protein
MAQRDVFAAVDLGRVIAVGVGGVLGIVVHEAMLETDAGN